MVNPTDATMAHQTGDRPVIDWTRLHALRADIGEAEFAELAAVFVAELGERLTALAADPDRATPEDFHFLRGGATNIGLSDMVARCTAAELACRTGTPPNIGAVRTAFRAAVVALEREFPGITGTAQGLG